MAKLFIVATPIGNLGDITLRASEILKSADMILAEDTRVTRKLLSYLHISRPVISFQEYSHPKVIEKILNLLQEGNNLALVADAGTPGVSDPGRRLIEAAKDIAEIVAVPGPSSLTAMISVSDIELAGFCFLGFPPHKKGRESFFKRAAKCEFPVVMFESPHRIKKTLLQLLRACGDRYVNIGRELTKIHEEVFRGKISDAEKYFSGEKERGEFVIIVSNA